MQRHNIINDVVRLGHTALEFSNTAEFRTEVLSQLEHTFRSSSSVFLDWEHVGEGARSWIENDLHFPHWDAEYRREYLQRLRHSDPLFGWLDSGSFTQCDSVTRLTNLISLKDLHRTPLYTDFLQPLKCQYILTLALNCGPDLVANVSLLRPSGDQDFSTADMQAARLAAPMLCGAYKRLLYKELLSEKTDLVDIISGLPRKQACVILSESMEPLYLSEPLKKVADGMFDNGTDGIRDVLFSSPAAGKYLKHFNNRRAASRRHLPKTLSATVRLPGGDPVRIEIHKLVTPRGTAYLRVLFHRVEKTLAPPELKEKSLLSMRELQIAQMIAEGDNTGQIGVALCISPWTVKNHLKSIYGKVGINNRAGLVRWLHREQ
tara:strand:+ start:83732 stop:84859 length:1128 start_codon:yes stop_codon:yes gene_type:complete